MMSIPWLVTAAAVEFFNTMPVAILLALVTTLVLRVAPRGNASTRYAAWWMCLVAIVALPVARQLASAPEELSETPVAVETVVSESGPVASMPAAMQRVAPPRDARLPPNPSWSFGAWPIEERGLVIESGWLAGVAFAVWAAGALASFFGLLRSYLWIRRRIARAKPVDAGEWVERCFARCRVGRNVQIRWSSEIGVPVAAGFLRPTVLLPASIAWRLEQSEIEDIVTHELAHLARRDDWAQLAERLISALLWFHPLVYWVMGRIQTERELCCDDWVVRSGAKARSYAASLVKLAEFRRSARLALAATAGKPEMSRRVEELLKGRPVSVRVSAVGIAVAATLLVGLILATARMPGVLLAMPAAQEEFEPPAPPTPPSPLSPVSPPSPVSPASPPSPPSQLSPPSPPSPASPRSPLAPIRIARAEPPEPPEPPQAAPAPKASPVPAPKASAAPAPKAAAAPKVPAAGSRPNGLLAALRATGYGDLSVEDIIELKNNGVGARFLLDLHEAGVPKLTARELIHLRQQGVSAPYLRGMLSAGIPDLATKDVVEFRQHNVDPKFVAAIKSLGYGPYTSRQIIDMANHGVKADFFEELKAYGITQIDARDAIDARNHGVNGAALREARQYGPNLSIRQIIKLKSAGVI